MQGLRRQTPTDFAGLTVQRMLDLTARREYVLEAGTLRPTATSTLPRSEVLQFDLSDESRISIRPSGTEPKLKFYLSVRRAAAGATDLARAKQAAQQQLQQLQAWLTELLR